MLIAIVDVYVKPEFVDEFTKATQSNARESLKEPGVARFDVLHDRADPAHFVLYEAYRDDNAPASHRETDHYQTWRSAVEHMMARSRSKTECTSVFPTEFT